MDAEEIKRRTKQFAIDIGKLTLRLERNDINRNYSNQIMRSGSSVGANYRHHEEPNQRQTSSIN